MSLVKNRAWVQRLYDCYQMPKPCDDEIHSETLTTYGGGPMYTLYMIIEEKLEEILSLRVPPELLAYKAYMVRNGVFDIEEEQSNETTE